MVLFKCPLLFYFEVFAVDYMHSGFSGINPYDLRCTLPKFQSYHVDISSILGVVR